MVIFAMLGGLYYLWPEFHAFVDDAYLALASGDQQLIQKWVHGFGIWGMVVILALILMQTLLAFVPSLLTMVVAVLAYGPVKGGLLAYGGLMLAACLGYGFGFSFGARVVERFLGTKVRERMTRLVERHGVVAIIIARLSPVLSTDAVSIAAGLVCMRFLPFLLATAGATLPLTVLVAWLGADIDRLKTGIVWVSVAGLVLLMVYILYDRKKGSPERTN